MTEIDRLIAEARDLAAELNRTLDCLGELGVRSTVVEVSTDMHTGRYMPVRWDRVQLQLTDVAPEAEGHV